MCYISLNREQIEGVAFEMALKRFELLERKLLANGKLETN